jgi:hypothetical protein
VIVVLPLLESPSRASCSKSSLEEKSHCGLSGGFSLNGGPCPYRSDGTVSVVHSLLALVRLNAYLWASYYQNTRAARHVMPLAALSQKA